MTKELRSRARFLMELVADFNDNHPDCRVTFWLDEDSVHISIEDKKLKPKILMSEYYFFKDLDEERVYEIYKKMHEVELKQVKSTANDDAPEMDS